MKNDILASVALSAAISALIAGTAGAQMHPEKPTWTFEKCYGVARAGRNDCFTSRNSCAGTTEKDGEPQAWVYVPRGTCERMTGGRLQPG